MQFKLRRNAVWVKATLFLAWTLFGLGGCSSPGKGLSGGFAGSDPRSGTETIVILGTNDIHGTLAPLHLKVQDDPEHGPVEYEAGGVALMSSIAKILRSEHGDRLIWLDGGDQFQGSIESNRELGRPMVHFFNEAGLTAAAIGNHEFDFGLDVLKSRSREAKYPYLSANILNKLSRQREEIPNTLPHQLVQAGRLKVGLIGLTTMDTPRTTIARNVKSLEFESLRLAALRESEALRQKGAHVVLLTAHVGLFCKRGKAPIGWAVRKASDLQGQCDENDELVQLLESLPAGTLDAVVAGHSHQIIHHWVAGIPVIQAGAFGRYVNTISLTYDWETQKLLEEETRIEGPIPVCSRVFKNQNDCNGDRPAPKQGRGPLVPMYFHGKEVKPDARVVRLLNSTLKAAEIEKKRVIGRAAHPLKTLFDQESSLGNLAADAVREAIQADVALVNSGGVRAPFGAGTIHYGDVFRAFPFENQIAVLKVTGRELQMILRVAESGSRGVAPFSGLEMTLIDFKKDAPQDDLNRDGLESPWKKNRILSLKLSDGRSIQPDHFYRLATLDFLVTGGDDLGWPMSQIPGDRIELTGMLIRDAVVQYLQKRPEVNSDQAPLVDPARPRIRFETPSAPTRLHHHRKKRKSHQL